MITEKTLGTVLIGLRFGRRRLIGLCKTIVRSVKSKPASYVSTVAVRVEGGRASGFRD